MVSVVYEYQKKYIKAYYEKNKELINEKRSKQIECDTCNCLIRIIGIATHKKTKKHLKNLEKLDKPIN